MPNAIDKHLALIVQAGIYLLTLGVLWGTQSYRITDSQRRIEALEAQRANEIRLIVDHQGKRIDQHDTVLSKLSESSTQMLVKLERIEGKLDGKTDKDGKGT